MHVATNVAEMPTGRVTGPAMGPVPPVWLHSPPGSTVQVQTQAANAGGKESSTPHGGPSLGPLLVTVASTTSAGESARFCLGCCAQVARPTEVEMCALLRDRRCSG